MFTSLDEEESHTIEDLFVCLTKRTMNCNGNRDEIDDKKKTLLEISWLTFRS